MEHTSQAQANQMRSYLSIVLNFPAESTSLRSPAVTDDRSLLLVLPAELRAMIYEYALTEKRGLITRGRWCYPASVYSERRDANQLKFVCRQLYAETKGLGLRFNSLTIKDNSFRFWFGNFTRFVGFECSAKNLSHLTEVILHDQIERFENTRSYHRSSRGGSRNPLVILERQLDAICSPSFVACCQKLSAATITIRMEVCRAHPDFLLWAEVGSLVQYLSRGTTSRMCESGMAWSREAQALAQRFFDRHGPSPFPPNVRFTPASFEVAQFGLSDYFNRMDPDIRNKWLDQGKSWYENGF